MSADKSRILVTAGTAPAGGTTVHHRDFPDIRANGASAAEAAQQLHNQLERAIDSALTKWRRESVESAMADVSAFLSDPS